MQPLTQWFTVSTGGLYCLSAKTRGSSQAEDTKTHQHAGVEAASIEFAPLRMDGTMKETTRKDTTLGS